MTADEFETAYLNLILDLAEAGDDVDRVAELELELEELKEKKRRRKKGWRPQFDLGKLWIAGIAVVWSQTKRSGKSRSDHIKELRR